MAQGGLSNADGIEAAIAGAAKKLAINSQA